MARGLLADNLSGMLRPSQTNVPIAVNRPYLTDRIQASTTFYHNFNLAKAIVESLEIMADTGDAKPTPSATQDASTGLTPAEHETNLVENPLGDPSSEASATTATDDKDPKSATYTETAANAASSAATTASAAASNIFSMFGGGAKKERKADDEDDVKDEPSGSSKVQKKEEDDEVGCITHYREFMN
jgi:hypothetical protein